MDNPSRTEHEDHGAPCLIRSIDSSTVNPINFDHGKEKLVHAVLEGPLGKVTEDRFPCLLRHSALPTPSSRKHGWNR